MDDAGRAGGIDRMLRPADVHCLRVARIGGRMNDRVNALERRPHAGPGCDVSLGPLRIGIRRRVPRPPAHDADAVPRALQGAHHRLAQRAGAAGHEHLHRSSHEHFEIDQRGVPVPRAADFREATLPVKFASSRLGVVRVQPNGIARPSLADLPRFVDAPAADAGSLQLWVDGH